MAKKSSKPAAKAKSKKETAAPAKANPVELGPAVTNAAADIPDAHVQPAGIVPAPVGEQAEEVALTVLREGEAAQLSVIPKDGATVGTALSHIGLSDTANYNLTCDGKKIVPGTKLTGNMTVTLEPRDKA